MLIAKALTLALTPDLLNPYRPHQCSEPHHHPIQIEGHGGWADRLPKLLLSPLLVIAQDVPARLWFESALRDGVTHLVTDSNLHNLSSVLKWARKHDDKVARMVNNAQGLMDSVLSMDGIRSYVREIVNEYTQHLLLERPRLHTRAVRFACDNSDDAATTCHVPRSTRSQDLRGEQCHFSRPGRNPRSQARFATLHEAAEALFDSRGGPRRQVATSTPESRLSQFARRSLRRLVCSSSNRTDARANQPPTWCFDFTSEAECHAHKVVGGRGCPSGERACVWRPAVHAHRYDVNALCLGSVHSKSNANQGDVGQGGMDCVAVCASCTSLCSTSS